MNNNQSIVDFEKHMMNLLLKNLVCRGIINQATYSKIVRKYGWKEVA